MMEHKDFDFDPINYLAIQVLEQLGNRFPSQIEIDLLENMFRDMPHTLDT